MNGGMWGTPQSLPALETKNLPTMGKKNLGVGNKFTKQGKPTIKSGPGVRGRIPREGDMTGREGGIIHGKVDMESTQNEGPVISEGEGWEGKKPGKKSPVSAKLPHEMTRRLREGTKGTKHGRRSPPVGGDLDLAVDKTTTRLDEDLEGACRQGGEQTW